MTLNKTVLVAAVAAGLVSATAIRAQGISFDGAYIQGEHITNFEGGVYDYEQSGIYGAAQASAGKFALQADLGLFGYDNNGLEYFYYALHGMYTISPNFVVGGYYGEDNWSGSTSTTYGIETKFTPSFLDGRMTVEAFIGAYKNQYSTDNPMIGVGVNYAVTDSIDVGASYLRGAWDDLSDPNDQYDVLELEATYTFANGLYATGSYTDTIFAGSGGQDATFGIAVGFNFGGGVTFDRRGYSALYPGD